MQISGLISKILHKFHPVRIFNRAKNSYIEFHTHAEFKIRFVSLIGAIGFPAYYVIWTYVFPQPYENFVLRLIGFVLCTVLFLTEYWPRIIGKYRIVYAYFTLIYALPFFFTYMLLMNQANLVWLLSAMAGLLFIVLLYDAINVAISTFIGVFAGVMLYFFQTGSFDIPNDLLPALPVFAFTFLGIIYLNYSDDIIARAKLTAASTLASHIAHETRTPLLGIKLEADKASKYLPKLVEVYEWAQQNGCEIRGIAKNQLKGFSGSMRRIKEHSSSANLMIDMLLMNVRYKDFPTDEFGIHSIKNTVEEALERYHYKPGEELLVDFRADQDFEYWGADVLLVHTLFNLMKNSFRAILAKGSGRIEIRLYRGEASNFLYFRDSGQGIPSDIVNYIFVPFFSGKTSSGAGVGLSFTKDVIESFGGEIRCKSIPGKGTEFALEFPKLHGAKR